MGSNQQKTNLLVKVFDSLIHCLDEVVSLYDDDFNTGKSFDPELMFCMYHTVQNRVEYIVESLLKLNEIELQFLDNLLVLGLEYFAITPQLEIPDTKRRVDFLVEYTFQEKYSCICVEINGSDYHTGLDNEKRDHERDLELQQQGFEVVYFTGKDVYHRAEECVEFLEKKLMENLK